MSVLLGERTPAVKAVVVLVVAFAVAGLVAAALLAKPAYAATFFSNPTPIAIPSGSGCFPDACEAAPYPSGIAVSGMSGPITDVDVTLHRVGHTWPDDIDILLVSPSGDNVVLMSDACGEDDIEDFTWTFSQQTLRAMSDDSADCGEFNYRPTNHDLDDIMRSPAPPGPYGASLNNFNNENPSGTWKLYVFDDSSGGGGACCGVGDIEVGWSIAIETGPTDVAIPATGTSGPASPYPATRTVSGEAGMISDLKRHHRRHLARASR